MTTRRGDMDDWKTLSDSTVSIMAVVTVMDTRAEEIMTVVRVCDE